jgi:predicted exporter
MNESLHEALRRAADDTAFGSHTSGQDLLRRARRRQAHHHVLTVAAAVTVVVAAAGAAAAMLPRLLDPHQAPVAVQPQPRRCPGRRAS